MVALALLAWALLHPDFRPDPGMVSRSVHEELAKTGFKATQGVASAAFESTETGDGYSEHWVARQKILPIDGLVTEKRTRRQTRALTQQSSGLYVGPLAVLRFRRDWPPLVGDLLPYHFWMSSRITEFVVQEKDNFPHASGGRMLAKVTYEDRYAGGALAQTERRRLHCEVQSLVAAASVHAGLSGLAARIDCNESLEPGGRSLGPDNSQAYALEDVSYSHWYVLDRGWSIPLEGEYTARVGNVPSVNKWKSKLISFE